VKIRDESTRVAGWLLALIVVGAAGGCGRTESKPGRASTVELVPASWLGQPLDRWWVVDPETNAELATVRGDWTSPPVRPGPVRIEIEPRLRNSKRVVYADDVTVSADRATLVPLTTGLSLDTPGEPKPPAPWRWWVTRPGGADPIQYTLEGWGPIPVAPGDYDVWVHPLEDRSKPVRLFDGVKVEAGRLVRLEAGSGIALEGRAGSKPPWRWYAVPADAQSTGEAAQYACGSWGPVLVPPGSYDVWIRPDPTASIDERIMTGVIVKAGSISRAAVTTGVRVVGPEALLSPWRVSLVEADTGVEVQRRSGYGFLPAPIGSYRLVVTPVEGRSNPVRLPPLVEVQKGIIEARIAFGAIIEAPPGLEAPWRIWLTTWDSKGGDEHQVQYAVESWGPLLAPPGTYRLHILPHRQTSIPVASKSPLRVTGKGLDRVRLVDHFGVLDIPAEAAKAKPWRWIITDSATGEPVQIKAGAWSAQLVPHGTYDVGRKDRRFEGAVEEVARGVVVPAP
jgi:hypothetical protein